MNKCRILNILRHHPVTISDCVKVLDLKESHARKFLNEFVQTGLIQKSAISHKLKIYHCLSVPEDKKTIKDLNKRLIADYPLDKLIYELYQGRKITDPGYFPERFIGEVFRLFKINDPQFDEDLKRYEFIRAQMTARDYLEKNARGFNKHIKNLLADPAIKKKRKDASLRYQLKLAEQGIY